MKNIDNILFTFIVTHVMFQHLTLSQLKCILSTQKMYDVKKNNSVCNFYCAMFHNLKRHLHHYISRTTICQIPLGMGESFQLVEHGTYLWYCRLWFPLALSIEEPPTRLGKCWLWPVLNRDRSNRQSSWN